VGVTNGGQVPWKTLRGNLSNLLITTPRLKATVSSVRLNYPATIHAGNTQITQGDLDINMQTLAVRAFR
jgi:hypothetical protein